MERKALNEDPLSPSVHLSFQAHNGLGYPLVFQSQQVYIDGLQRLFQPGTMDLTALHMSAESNSRRERTNLSGWIAFTP